MQMVCVIHGTVMLTGNAAYRTRESSEISGMEEADQKFPTGADNRRGIQ